MLSLRSFAFGFVASHVENSHFRLLRRSWALLGRSWVVLGRSWGRLEAVLGRLVPSWGDLGASWKDLGAILGRLEGILGGSWAPKRPDGNFPEPRRGRSGGRGVGPTLYFTFGKYDRFRRNRSFTFFEGIIDRSPRGSTRPFRKEAAGLVFSL